MPSLLGGWVGSQESFLEEEVLLCHSRAFNDFVKTSSFPVSTLTLSTWVIWGKSLTSLCFRSWPENWGSHGSSLALWGGSAYFYLQNSKTAW